jgi:hypothetical protein
MATAFDLEEGSTHSTSSNHASHLTAVALGRREVKLRLIP